MGRDQEDARGDRGGLDVAAQHRADVGRRTRRCRREGRLDGPGDETGGKGRAERPSPGDSRPERRTAPAPFARHPLDPGADLRLRVRRLDRERPLPRRTEPSLHRRALRRIRTPLTSFSPILPCKGRQHPLQAEDGLRGAVVAALDDPAASPEQLLAARDWLQHLGYRVSENDEGIVLRIVQDRRVPDIGKLLFRFYQDGAPVTFRHAFVRRVLDPATNAWDRDYYARMLSRMPVGTFAEPTRTRARSGAIRGFTRRPGRSSSGWPTRRPRAHADNRAAARSGGDPLMAAKAAARA